MNGISDHQTDSVMLKRAYSAPILVRSGTLTDVTRSMGHKGSKDGQQTGNQKRTSW